MNDLETRLRATFMGIAESAEAPPLPQFTVGPDDYVNVLDSMLAAPVGPGRRRWDRLSRRRRAALVGVTAFVALGGGLSIAAGPDVPGLPGRVTAALGWTPAPGAYNARTATARRLLTVPGPEGQPLQLWFADADDDGYCLSLSAAVDTSATTPQGYVPAPAQVPSNGAGAGGCAGPVGDRNWRAFGGDYFCAFNAESATFIVHVPGAAHVELVLDDGATRELPIGDGWTAGWITAHQATQHPVLIGTAADGARVGTFVPIVN